MREMSDLVARTAVGTMFSGADAGWLAHPPTPFQSSTHTSGLAPAVQAVASRSCGPSPDPLPGYSAGGRSCGPPLRPPSLAIQCRR